MTHKTSFIYTFLILFVFSCSTDSEPTDTEEGSTENSYFPTVGSDTWQTKSPEELNWNTDEIPTLLNYLEDTNSKSFMILHEGKIIIEHYMNEHTQSKIWYWASSGKTLTSATTGIAQEEGLLNINNKVSDYLGTGWTSTPLAKENVITLKNLLQMDSGLDDTLGDDVSTENLQYIADAGSRWAYHNVYVKLQDIIATASNSTWKEYFNTSLRDKIGMTGNWTNLSNLSVYWSDTRSMARFGLLISRNGQWEGSQIIPNDYLHSAINTSQDINKSYGYLWWLNGKQRYHLPQSQLEFDGSLIPNAPNDMYAALGKNDQKIYIIPSRDLVIIRMGEAAADENFALSTFDNDLWALINNVIN
ncbi:serine hydrolase [Cellulophaga sp. L1A9]|uniref:serine hydrolase domain-containing protein n=1 Tax=Cellulophaga sp. L1A9 TaxID=2686362 RepID=UPI00131DA846|nr:serine hydrolase [Cellulophaga sp. L1A9]